NVRVPPKSALAEVMNDSMTSLKTEVDVSKSSPTLKGTPSGAIKLPLLKFMLKATFPSEAMLGEDARPANAPPPDPVAGVRGPLRRARKPPPRLVPGPAPGPYKATWTCDCALEDRVGVKKDATLRLPSMWRLKEVRTDPVAPGGGVITMSVKVAWAPLWAEYVVKTSGSVGVPIS